MRDRVGEKLKYVNKINAMALRITVILAVIGIIYSFAGIAVVAGHSMDDSYHDKQKVLFVKNSDIEDGDVIIVNTDKIDNGTLLIKRVIAMEGETIEIRDGVVYRNNVAIDEPYAIGITSDHEKEVIQKDEYFVMGDNREYSLDSRVLGVVNKEDILGEVVKNDYR